MPTLFALYVYVCCETGDSMLQKQRKNEGVIFSRFAPIDLPANRFTVTATRMSASPTVSAPLLPLYTRFARGNIELHYRALTEIAFVFRYCLLRLRTMNSVSSFETRVVDFPIT